MSSIKYREVTEEELSFIIRECDYRNFREIRYPYGLTGYTVVCFYEGKLLCTVVATYNYWDEKCEKKYFIEDIA